MNSDINTGVFLSIISEAPVGGITSSRKVLSSPSCSPIACATLNLISNSTTSPDSRILSSVPVIKDFILFI